MADRIAVIGAGTMGRGIAHVAALSGHPTLLYDVSEELLTRGRAEIERRVERAIEKGKIPSSARDQLQANLRTFTDLPSAVAGARFVIEAVPEDLELKQRVFSDCAATVADDTVFASNTSSLSIAALASGVVNPGRVIGMHFFNPVPVMALVEVVVGVNTDPQVTDATTALARAFGKEPIVVQDSPGFASSRLGLVIGLEAIRMLEAGVASAADIDKAMELGYRHPMGPLKLTDLVGLDVRLAIAEYLHKEIGDQFRPPELLRKLVRDGHLGRKSGRGFYEYEGSAGA